MQAYLPEKISNPDLFSGRKKELELFQRWIAGIPRGLSRSRALLSRRKTGKTAIMQRLYNLTFEKENGVIPLYYEVKEGKIWAVDFCAELFITFLFQYIAYKTRKPEYLVLSGEQKGDFAVLKEVVRQEGGEYLLPDINGVELLFKEQHINRLWSAVREWPYISAARQGEYMVQMLDEFQYLTSEITRDPEGTQVIEDFPAGYLSTAEYRHAPC